MALEDLITKLIASLDANTAAVKASKGAAAATSTTTAGAETKKVKDPKAEFDRLKALGQKVIDKQGKPFAKKLILDVGGAKELAAVKVEKYPALIKAFESALADSSEAEEADEDDDDL